MNQPAPSSLDPQHPAPPGSAASRRHAKHVSRACNGCRRRKSKCDGVHPICDTCSALQHECTWTAEEDGRRPATKAQIVSMTMEIRALKDERDRHEALIARLRDEVRQLGGNSANQLVHPNGLGPDLRVGIPSDVSAPHPLAVGVPGSDFLVPGPTGTAMQRTPSPALDPLGSSPVNRLPDPLHSPMPVMGQGLSPPDEVGDGDTSMALDIEDTIIAAGPMAGFLSTGKRLAVFDDNDEIIAVSSSSPLGFGMHPTKRPRLTSPAKPTSKAPSTGTSKTTGRKDAPVVPTRAIGTEHDGSCPCDWARFLPAVLISPASNTRIESLPPSSFVPGRRHPQKTTPLSQAEHDRALEDYFTHVASWQMRVVPKLFLRDMRSTLSVTPRTMEDQPPRRKSIMHYSPALHCALLADAGKYTPPDSVLAQRSTRELLAKSAREYIEIESAAPHSCIIPTILALSVLAQYHLGTHRGARYAFSLFGMAVRLALCAGMNLDARPLLTDLAVDEADVAEEVWAREWCWRALFVQDVDMSLHVGQELSIVPPGEPSVNFAQQGDFLVGETFSRTVRLMSIGARMMALLGRRSTKPTASAVSAIQTELALWQADLPDVLRVHRESTSHAFGHVLVLHMTAQWITILLHRPFYMGQHGTETSRKFLEDATGKLLRALGTYQRLYGLGRAPLSVVQIAFVAGAAALLRVESPSPSSAQKKKRSEALSMAKQAVDTLRELTGVYPCAGAYAEALDRRTELVKEHVAEHDRLQSHPQSHKRPSSSSGGGSGGHDRSSSSISVDTVSVSSASASSASMGSGYNSPSPTLDLGASIARPIRPAPAEQRQLPSVIVRQASTDSRMDLDPHAAPDPDALFNLFGTPVSDVTSFVDEGEPGWGTTNPFGFPIATDAYGALQQDLFAGSLPNPDLGVFMNGHVSSENVHMLGLPPFVPAPPLVSESQRGSSDERYGQMHHQHGHPSPPLEPHHSLQQQQQQQQRPQWDGRGWSQ